MMKNCIMNVYYVIVLTLCIDGGDGRWKKSSREKLERDISIFRKISENIEREIDDFYDDDYKGLDDKFYDDTHVELETGTSKKFYNKLILEPTRHSLPNVSSVTKQYNKNEYPHTEYAKKVRAFSSFSFVPFTDRENTIDEVTTRDSTWPKFEDMLLSIGKKYDWKNDRWIKVREKAKKGSEKQNISRNRIDFLSKHKFNYRFIKLNRSKSKRNVILAVKAVR
ncbi:unnamed protein product [Plutella xylostella]|uniref:(diamondback moth) hypothetical protein n=1 Tax=Plutella xylostella TaxID=51655 RepID=A0A8S4DA73_PLUXY|nr:unnamed protein product [Plutella xylostella]